MQHAHTSVLEPLTTNTPVPVAPAMVTDPASCIWVTAVAGTTVIAPCARSTPNLTQLTPLIVAVVVVCPSRASAVPEGPPRTSADKYRPRGASSTSMASLHAKLPDTTADRVAALTLMPNVRVGGSVNGADSASVVAFVTPSAIAPAPLVRSATSPGCSPTVNPKP